MTAIFLGVVGGAVLLALVFSGVSLYVTLRSGSVATIDRTLAAVRLELADVVDRVEQWQKRDRVRRLREGKEDAQNPDPELALDKATDKFAALRARRAAQGRG